MPAVRQTPRRGRTIVRRDVWPRALPFALFVVLMALEPRMGAMVSPGIDPRWLYGARSLATGVVLAIVWRRLGEVRGGPRASAWAWAAAAGIGLAVFALWILLDFPPLVVGAGSGFDPRVGGRIHLAFALTRLTGSVLVVPVMEEIFWRSFIMRWIERPGFLQVDPHGVGWKALVISSALFALEHHLWLAGLLAGLAYGELYRRTGSLRLAIFSHAVTNGALGAWVLRTGAWGFW